MQLSLNLLSSLAVTQRGWGGGGIGRGTNMPHLKKIIAAEKFRRI